MRSLKLLQASGSIVSSVFGRKSLTLNILLWTVALGVCIWLAFDLIHKSSTQDLISSEFQTEATLQAANQQQQIQKSFGLYRNTTHLLANYQPLQQQLNNWTSSTEDLKFPLIYRGTPAWLASANIKDIALPIHYAVIMGPRYNVMGIYEHIADSLPEQLTFPDAALISSGLDKAIISSLGDENYMLSTTTIISPDGREQGVLLLATRFNDALLQLILGDQANYLASTVVNTQTGEVLASTGKVPVEAAPEQEISDNRFILIADERLSGTPETSWLRLVTWFDNRQLDDLRGAFLKLDRKQRSTSFIAFLILLLGIVYSLRSRLNTINQNIKSYSERLGIQQSMNETGDKIDLINVNLARFGDEMISETRALEYQARHDTLTSLPNRSLLLERLHAEIRQCELDHSSLALLIIDLDRFKEVNDTLGHHVGDRLLQEVGRRLIGLLRRSDSVARLGGDEFAILLPDADQAQAGTVCQKIIAALDKPVKVEDFSLRTGASIGVVMCPEQGHDANMLMRRADVAMYDAKQHSKGFSIYAEDKDQNNINQLGLSSELRDAIDHNQLLLEYQPLVDVKAGKVHCVEALVRWQHPKMGLIPPDKFVFLAEQTGSIRPLTLWVINHGLAQVDAWNESGLDIKISINLSVRCLQDRQLPSQVQQLVDKYQVDPKNIMLEVTESAIMSDPLTARRVMRRLSNIGFQLSIDDFGTGYSSLSYLKQLPVDEIKIDKSFVSNMDENENDAVIVKATIDLAHNLGLKVVAEGVETHEVWEQIQALGCDSAQGYFIKKPMAAKDLALWVRSNEWSKKVTQPRKKKAVANS